MKFTFILLISLSFKSFAFDKKGHQSIELKAYDLLKAHPASSNVPNGTDVLKFLKNEGILKNDELPHSHFPDVSLDRQFEPNRQMYHFMANNSDARNAAKLSGANRQKEYLLLASLPANLKLIYFLFREAVENCPEGPSQSGRGIYVLMHIVADSYSPEHTLREESSSSVITIKGWRFTGLFWPSEAKAPEESTLRLLHNTLFKAKGDSMWGKENELSEIGLNAANALMELLITTYRARKNPKESDDLIVNYLKKHFTPFNNHDNPQGFEVNGKLIPISYKKEYEAKVSRDAVFFGFDRSPQIFIEIQGQINMPATNALTSYGIAYGRYIAPKNADAAPFLFFRIPWGWSFSLNKFSNINNKNFVENIRSKIFFFISGALPLINGAIEPKMGLAITPLNNQKHFTINPGVDLVWNVGGDFYTRLLNKNLKIVSPNSRLRLSIGYEYEAFNKEANIGTMNSHYLNLKIGFNTFHTRMPFSTCR